MNRSHVHMFVSIHTSASVGWKMHGCGTLFERDEKTSVVVAYEKLKVQQVSKCSVFKLQQGCPSFSIGRGPGWTGAR